MGTMPTGHNERIKNGKGPARHRDGMQYREHHVLPLHLRLSPPPPPPPPFLHLLPLHLLHLLYFSTSSPSPSSRLPSGEVEVNNENQDVSNNNSGWRGKSFQVKKCQMRAEWGTWKVTLVQGSLLTARYLDGQELWKADWCGPCWAPDSAPWSPSTPPP